MAKGEIDESPSLSSASAEMGSPGTSIREAGLAVRVQVTPKSTWRSYIWDSLGKSPEERRFLAKLDAVLLIYASLGEFMEACDQLSMNNAFVSGMKEDLHLYGNELNYLLTCWTVGYVLGQIPSNVLLTRIRPRFWIPACQAAWALLAVTTAKCTSVRQMYAIRFGVGLAQSSFFPGMQYVIASWYRKDELGKRSCICPAGYTIGTILSGLIMAAIFKGLNGVAGLRGWQWLFVINTCLALPIAIAGFFVLPDVPEITQAWYLSPAEVALSRKRMELEGRANRGLYTRAKLARILTGWHLYLLSLLYIMYLNAAAFGAQPAFALWLKGRGYGVTAINAYPALTAGLTLLVTVVCAWTSDSVFRGARWPPVVFSGFVNIVVSSCMAVWDIPDSWKWACFILIGLTPGISGIFFAWAHEICSADNEERALVTATMNKMAYVVQAWLPLLIWPQVEAPRYPKGYITMAVFGAGLMITALVTRWLDHWERAEKARQTKGRVEPSRCAESAAAVRPKSSSSH